MKTHITGIILGSSILAACSNEPVVIDPYADLAEDTLLVRFEANPDVAEGECNPNVHYALRTSEEYVRFNANYEVVDQNLTGSGASMVNENESGVASTTIQLSMFDAYPLPCSELQVRAQDITCQTDDAQESSPCPSPQFEGTEMFASFRGLPDY